MVIDLILDRQDGETYVARDFYNDCMDYEQFEIARAMDCGTEEDVKRALCSYIDGEYNPQIKEFINSVDWLTDDKEEVEIRIDEEMDRQIDEKVKEIYPQEFIDNACRQIEKDVNDFINSLFVKRVEL